MLACGSPKSMPTTISIQEMTTTIARDRKQHKAKQIESEILLPWNYGRPATSCRHTAPTSTTTLGCCHPPTITSHLTGAATQQKHHSATSSSTNRAASLAVLSTAPVPCNSTPHCATRRRRTNTPPPRTTRDFALAGSASDKGGQMASGAA